ncbi:MAG: AMP-dependent synthetase and ligase [Proteobacteria bacterium]|nr:AMP-dependent synthetase and ligase [Pseudomonadota bacterium]
MSRQALATLLTEGRSAGHPVCHDGQRLVAWEEFSARVATRAAHFAERRELRWLLSGDDALDFALSLLALLHAGKQVVIPPNAQAGTLAQLAGAFDARADGAEHASARLPLAPIDPQTAIIDLYTSGSTGAPKRIRKTLAQFDAEVAILEQLWGATLGQASVVATAPHQHIYGLLFRLFWPLSAGRPFDNVTCAHPDTLGERLALLRDCALVSSPAQLARLPELVPLASLQPAPKIIFSSGGPLPATTAAHYHRLGLAPVEVFGSTETGGIAWRRQQGQAFSETWTPFPGIFVDRANDGALSLRSPFLADDSPWRMDDAIELLPAGRFRLCGRLDRIVKIEEKRLSLPDMEARLLDHPWVSRAAVLALPGKRQSVGAVVVLHDAGRQQLAAQGRRHAAQQLRRHLGAHFEAVLLPRRWRFPERLPVDERGKLTRDALLELFADGAPAAPPAPPDAPLQAQVLAVREPCGARRQVVIDLLVPRELAHFAGHFPDLPILPGVVQIDWAIRHAREHLPLRGQFTALENIKFQALVLPDTQLELTLTWDDENARLDFIFANSQRRCSSGRIVFDSAA